MITEGAIDENGDKTTESEVAVKNMTNTEEDMRLGEAMTQRACQRAAVNKVRRLGSHAPGEVMVQPKGPRFPLVFQTGGTIIIEKEDEAEKEQPRQPLVGKERLTLGTAATPPRVEADL